MTDRVDQINNELLKISEGWVGSGITNSLELDKACKLLLKNYLTTTSSDNIPLKRRKGQSFITNVDTSNQLGSHWVACYCLSSTKLLVYDSFGRKTKTLIPHMKGKISDTEYDAEQSKKEENCGARCIAWLLLCEHWSPELAKDL